MFRIDELPKGLDALQKATPQAQIPTGWRCPACGHINGPHVAQCPSCNQQKDPR